MKNLLLFTSDKVGNTGEVSWNFIFQDNNFKAFERFPEHMHSPFWGMFKEPDDDDEDQIGFNIFETGHGLKMAGPITNNDTERNKKIISEFPDYSYMLCTTKTANRIIENLKDLDIKIEVLHSDKTLTSS